MTRCGMRARMWAWRRSIGCSRNLRAAGLVTRHHFETGHSVFELAKGEHHDHMVCVSSGAVVEFTDSVIEQRQREIAHEYGYELIDHSLVLYVRKKEKLRRS